MGKLKIVDDTLIGNVVKQAQASPRLRMNYNFHEDLGDKCQRLLNTLEPGTVIFEVKEGPYIPDEIGGVLEV